MKYPNKIYLQDLIELGWEDCITWSETKTHQNDVEYIRADLVKATQQNDTPDAKSGTDLKRWKPKDIGQGPRTRR